MIKNDKTELKKKRKLILCDVYKSQSKSEVYIYVDKVDGLSRVPEKLLEEFEDPEFCFSFKLTEDRKLAREESQKVIDNLKEQGYHLQMPPLIRGQLGKDEEPGRDQDPHKDQEA